MAWPQIFIDQDGSRGWDSPLVKSFDVQSIPTIILLDADGRVTKVNLRGNDIAASVAQILGKPIPPPDPIAAAAPTQRPVSTARKIQPGDLLDLGGPTLAGPDLKLSQFRGKPVLVEFWASWCDHCVKEMPNVAAVNKKYGSKGLQVVGISLDKQKSDLVKTISDAGIDWPQIFFDRDGSRGWENPLAQKFGVTGIPFIVLVGPDGKVQKTALRGQAIDDAVGIALAGSGK
jgi:thiol-disulfide isomerase/thioredoxin